MKLAGTLAICLAGAPLLVAGAPITGTLRLPRKEGANIKAGGSSSYHHQVANVLPVIERATNGIGNIGNIADSAVKLATSIFSLNPADIAKNAVNLGGSITQAAVALGEGVVNNAGSSSSGGNGNVTETSEKKDKSGSAGVDAGDLVETLTKALKAITPTEASGSKDGKSDSKKEDTSDSKGSGASDLVGTIDKAVQAVVPSGEGSKETKGDVTSDAAGAIEKAVGAFIPGASGEGKGEEAASPAASLLKPFLGGGGEAGGDGQGLLSEFPTDIVKGLSDGGIGEGLTEGLSEGLGSVTGGLGGLGF
ncbi:hypothetical protein BBAD15_g10139 [Beauveria bassiana D1-5]|uniref:Uncharacterized protein n=1 Tax=Beauveria bassiana D1-5 TaxID=1245745 RepID=A0A0A2VET8_BEABA|nr:hypothetical protein BBAD15_g10139 [Beauveria bassiana D1-5]